MNENILIENKKEDKYALDVEDLKLFCLKNNLFFNIIIGLDKLDANSPLFSYIHTGTKKDNFNNGITNHWLILLPQNYIFDSYGNFLSPKINLPKPFKIINNERYQAFDTNVCGAYCSAIYLFLKKDYKPIKKGTLNFNLLFQQFDDYYGFTKNYSANDTIIQKWWNQQMKPLEKTLK